MALFLFPGARRARPALCGADAAKRFPWEIGGPGGKNPSFSERKGSSPLVFRHSLGNAQFLVIEKNVTIHGARGGVYTSGELKKRRLWFMRSTKAIRAAKAGYIIMSLLFCALGLTMIVKHDLSVSLIGMAAGAMLVAFGVVKLAGFFSKDLYRLAFQYDLAFGLTKSAQILTVLLGVSMLSEGVLNLGVALCAVKIIRHQRPDVIECEYEVKERKD